MPDRNPASLAANVLKLGYNPVQMAENLGKMRVMGELQKQKRQQELALKNESELERLFPIKVKEVMASHKEGLVNRLTETREHAEQLSVKYGGIDKVPPLERMKLNSEWANVNIDMDNSSKLLALTNKLTDVINTNPKVNKQKSITNLMGLLDMPLKGMAENSPDFANKVANVIEFNKAPEDWLKEGLEYQKTFPPVNYEDAETYGKRPDEKGARTMSDMKFNEKTPEGDERRTVFGTADNYFNSLVKPALLQGETKYKPNRSGSGSGSHGGGGGGTTKKYWDNPRQSSFLITTTEGGQKVNVNKTIPDFRPYLGTKTGLVNASDFVPADGVSYPLKKTDQVKFTPKGKGIMKIHGVDTEVGIGTIEDTRADKKIKTGYVIWKPEYDDRFVTDDGGQTTKQTTTQSTNKWKKYKM